MLEAPAAFLLFSLLCNLVSILAPARLALGTLQVKKPKPVVFLVAFLNLMVMPVIALPLLVPPVLKLIFASAHWAPWFPVNVLAAALILVAAAVLYALLLPLEGRLLQRREQAILREVTEATE
jgi:hypothetical protein